LNGNKKLMLVVDQLKKADPQIRMLALIVLSGLGVLLAGVWWVQVVSSRKYQSHLETQSYRTVRIPAVRGKITDQTGVAMAENRPAYHISVYLEELRKFFDAAYSREVARARADLKARAQQQEKGLGRKLNKEERKQFVLGLKDKNELRQRARSEVVSNVVQQVGHRLNESLVFDETQFRKHYQTRLALPYPILKNLNPTQIALFEEQSTGIPGVDLEVQSVRFYPFNSTAAHVLGFLKRDDDSAEGEEAFFSYRLPDYRGLVGIEAGYDKELRGTAGAKSVLVNNVGYRQTENIWSPAEPGMNVVLTLDLALQDAAEKALQSAQGTATRGAVVVMDVTTGDLLAMASCPTLDPNIFVQGITSPEWQRINELRAQLNLATQENYAPGSIFKTLVGLAALEAGLDPNEIHTAIPNPEQPSKAIIYVGRRGWKDLAGPGEYDFKRALKLSSNSYFITAGLRTGPERIVRLGQKFHLGERTGLPTRQEVSGAFPSLRRVSIGWTEGNTANLSIGQDPVLVTPLQVAVLTSAIANGGKVLWPRLVDRLEWQEAVPGETPVVFPRAQVRDELGVKPRSLEVLRAAMLADVEDSDGTGRKAAVPGMRICGKTGTAQVKNPMGETTGQTTWFASFAPFEKPRYAVVVMVEDGISGGGTCAPVAGKIYTAILERQKRDNLRPNALASTTR
jgi:penicillin-binding protein 2